jgi:hypothetical protein
MRVTDFNRHHLLLQKLPQVPLSVWDNTVLNDTVTLLELQFQCHDINRSHLVLHIFCLIKNIIKILQPTSYSFCGS